MKCILHSQKVKDHQPIEDVDTGEIFCKDCGIVLEDKVAILDTRVIDDKKRNWIEKADHSPNIGTSTMIGTGAKKDKNSDMYRLQVWDKRIKGRAGIRINNKVQTKIVNVCDKLNLPDFVNKEACNIYIKFKKTGKTKGHSIDTTIAGCILLSCRKNNILKKIKEIAETCNITANQLFKMYRVLQQKFDTKVEFTTPEGYLNSVATNFDFHPKSVPLAQKLIHILRTKTNNSILVGKNPVVVAAACVYLCSNHYGQRIGQTKIAKSVGTSEVSIRHFIKDIPKDLWLLALKE